MSEDRDTVPSGLDMRRNGRSLDNLVEKVRSILVDWDGRDFGGLVVYEEMDNLVDWDGRDFGGLVVYEEMDNLVEMVRSILVDWDGRDFGGLVVYEEMDNLVEKVRGIRVDCRMREDVASIQAGVDSGRMRVLGDMMMVVLSMMMERKKVDRMV